MCKGRKRDLDKKETCEVRKIELSERRQHKAIKTENNELKVSHS